MKKTITIILACFSCAVSGQSQSPSLLDPKLRDLFHEALSGEMAKEHVIAITRHHRIQGSRGYRAAAQYVLGKLKEYGFSEKDAYIESYKSDGKVQYQTWQSPSGWDITSAELRMVQPDTERIVGYPEIPMSVITYSNTGDVTTELVWVGSGESDDDYKGRDVRGKFVLATGYGGSVHRLAVLKYGAKAVVCYLDDDRAKLYPDMLQYTGMWPRTEELDRVTFGFNLTNRQGTKLKQLLESGKKVVLHGEVKGIGLEPFWMDVVVAHIRGTDRADEELVFSAHLDHPKESANDNASGSGAILDIARTLKELIDNGRLPKPGRSFRFLWVPEW
ncbi:MAG TPA: M28 family peptidase, partial [Bacteroidota bacterium]|nr:M28 family peptidase [Bacteroidota bacterium]